MKLTTSRGTETLFQNEHQQRHAIAASNADNKSGMRVGTRWLSRSEVAELAARLLAWCETGSLELKPNGLGTFDVQPGTAYTIDVPGGLSGGAGGGGCAGDATLGPDGRYYVGGPPEFGPGGGTFSGTAHGTNGKGT